MEEKMNMSVGIDRSTEIARMIMEAAMWEARSQPPTQPDGTPTTPEHLRVTADNIRSGANLVFLSLDLIQEWQQREKP